VLVALRVVGVVGIGRVICWCLYTLLAVVLLIAMLLGGLELSRPSTTAAGSGQGSAFDPAMLGRLSPTAIAEIPSDQIRAMVDTASRSSCGISWTVLAGVARVESGFGRNMNTSSAGALGYGQFLPSTWAAYGNGGNPYAYQDALPAMARYLCALGAGDNLTLALWRYSGCVPGPSCARSDNYPGQVLDYAQQYALANTVPELSASVDQLFATAIAWLNVPYLLGGNSRAGIDCSALMQIVFRSVGINLPRTAQQQYDATQRVAQASLQPGDLLFFTNTYDAGTFITHVGLYLGAPNGVPTMISAAGAAVSYANPFSGYWAQHFVAGGRV
jgi:cell wall-associated NlpC family hydrolase